MKIKALVLTALTVFATVQTSTHAKADHRGEAIAAGAVLLGLGIAAAASEHRHHHRHHHHHRHDYDRPRHYYPEPSRLYYDRNGERWTYDRYLGRYVYDPVYRPRYPYPY